MIINYIKFSLIVFFFVISIFHKKVISENDKKLQAIALFFTVISDLFLVILNWQAMGVFTFIFVQICYFVRLKINKKILPIYAFIFIILFFICGEILLALALTYGLIFITNYISAWKMFIKKEVPLVNTYLILIGLTLFLLCDICVALYNLHLLNIHLSVTFLTFLSYSIWIFYIPSQLLLSFSSRNFSN